LRCGRFADIYNCIKTAFHDTDILADILAILGEDVGVVECGLYAIVCVGETSVLLNTELEDDAVSTSVYTQALT